MSEWRDCEEYYETPQYEIDKADFDLMQEQIEYETKQEEEKQCLENS